MKRKQTAADAEAHSHRLLQAYILIRSHGPRLTYRSLHAIVGALFRGIAAMRFCVLFPGIVALAWLHPLMAATAPTPPLPITSHAVTAADYPVDSIPLQEQGVARVDYTVRVDGAVNELKIAQSSGSPRLDTAAIAIVSRWRFRPAMQNGRAMSWRQFANVAFVLK